MVHETLEGGQATHQGFRNAPRDELIRKYLPLIKSVASRILWKLPPQIEINDLINSGVIGLIDAIDKFDPDREIKFETYAEFRIRGAILDELRSQDWVPRSIRQRLKWLERTYQELETRNSRPATEDEVAQAMGLSQDDLHSLLNQASGVNLISIEDLGYAKEPGSARRDFLEYFKDVSQESLIDRLDLREVKGILAEAIDGLPKNERFVVSMYYYDELTMKEIGLVLGITESRVSQIHNQSMLRLRGKLKRRLRANA